MAEGRRDYTWGFLNEAATEGRYNESYAKRVELEISPGQYVGVWSYTVPEGWQLNLNRIVVSSNSGVVNFYVVVIDTTSIAQAYFSVTHELVFSDQNPFAVHEGEELRVLCYNRDEITAYFILTIIGCLQSLI